MLGLYLIVSIMFVALSTFVAVKAVKKGVSKKKAVLLQMCSTACVMVICFCGVVMSNSVKAAETTTAASAVSAEVAGAALSASGWISVAAAVAMGLACIGGGIAIASAAPAAIAATSEDPKAFTKALIFVALGEGAVILGFVMAMMILAKVDQLLAIIGAA